MKKLFLKILLIVGLPTIISFIIGLFFNSTTLFTIIGLSIGLVIFSWVAIVKIRHITRSVKKMYRSNPL